jgi:AraC-like DNA-binding protein
LLRDIRGTVIGSEGKPPREGAMESRSHGARKYPTFALIGSSAALGWSTAAGRLPLAEIALNAQFSSQASFTRSFHRAAGVTPKEYQRRRR